MLNWLKENIGIPKSFSVLGIVLIIILVILLLFKVTCVTWVDQYELGYMYDAQTGQITKFDRTGYFITKPLIQHVHTIDLRPQQVCIARDTPGFKRILNCKLVKFNSEGLNVFLSYHGRGDYNMDSLNSYLMAYAYEGSGKNYPFLDVIRELKNDEKE